MAPKITKGILESYLKCPYKAYLKLSGQRGTVSDYEHLLGESDDEVKRNAAYKILASKADVATGVPLTVAALRRGPDFVLDPMLDNDFLSLAFDGLKRVDEPSNLGTFHYVPMLFHGEQRFRKERRQLLEVYGSLLSQIQGRQPAKGIIWQPPNCKTTTIRLNLELRKNERLLREVKEARGASEPPSLILNDHCQVCEFRQQCHEQALQQDNLSLLRGIGEKEIKRYAKKGILTIRQLAHTFRPRRKGKRSAPRQNHRYHALQALALRDKTVYVLGTPALPVAPVHVYLDIEGKPDERFDYLIGMIITDGDDETRFSFWANDSIQEEQILDQFLDILKPYQHFLVFAYGGYEAAFLKRIRQRTKRKAEIDRILNSLVNILSTVYSHIYFPTYSNSLKNVAHLLGASWTVSNASGIHSLVWRMRWEKSQDEQWKQRLTTYNMEDCAALRQVTAFIYTQCSTPELAHDVSGVTNGLAVASVDEIDRLGTV